MSETKSKFTVREMVLIALMAVLIAVCSWISIPAAVPFTLQTFAVFCALSLLGGKNGMFSVIVYILLGAIGIPVFSGFKGGLGVLLGSTGGYIIGFVILAAVYWAAEKIPVSSAKVRLVLDISALVLGTALCYAFGTLWFVHVYSSKNGAIEMYDALKWCVFPFIPFDVIKLVLAVIVPKTIKTYANK